MLKKIKKGLNILGLYGVFTIGKFIRDSVEKDAKYLKILYRYRMGKKLNIDNPKTFNEKIQWLKLYDRKDLYTKIVDKYEVRKYIEDKIGAEYLIPLLGVYNSFDEINFELLPKQFVIKCTHDSGGLVICKDKNKLNIEKARKKISKCLNRNYFYNTREWPYKNVKPRIIIEKYMVDESRTELKDYKFFCFDGKVKSLFVASDRDTDTRFDFYDINFNKLPLKQYYENGTKEISKPKGYDEMLKLSSKLSKGFPHVRVDFYDINGKIYFGELTLSHFSGLKKFEPEKYDYLFGDFIKLPDK